MVTLEKDRAGSRRVRRQCSSGATQQRFVIDDRDAVENNRHMLVEQRDVHGLPYPVRLFHGLRWSDTGIDAAAWLTVASLAAAQNADPFVGRWALTIPNGGSGWLSIDQKNGYLDGAILWGGGSVKPVSSVYVDGSTLHITRSHEVKRKGSDGKPVQSQVFTETLTGVISGDGMKMVQNRPNPNGKGVSRGNFSAKKMPPIPPRPDLSKAKYGEPINIFNGKNLDGWRLIHPSHKNGWSAKDGVLVNRPEPGKKGYGNLRTDAEFEDFNLKLDVLVPERSNSGIYLRGMYEVQVLDSFGRKPDSHNMGGVYSRITPSQAVEKPHGVWQTMDITLLDQHVTVILNGVTIIDNEPLLGCTGGALSPDPSRPGPILLQGNHGGVEYKNIVLTPVK